MQNNAGETVSQHTYKDDGNFDTNNSDKFDALLELLQRRFLSSSSSQLSKASVDASTPIFRGDHTDKIDCGRWIETFEREARYHELDRVYWPMAATKRFPADSSASNWVDSVFGSGLGFEAEWSEFRRDFLQHFTPPDALPVASSNFNNLHLVPNGNIVEFNQKFTDLATRLNCVLRDSSLPCLTPQTVCLAYQTKLCGPVRIHIDQYLSQRKIFNVERLRDGRPTFDVTPKELLAASQQFGSQMVQMNTNLQSQQLPQQGASSTHHDTTSMNIDAMIEERFNSLQRSSRFLSSDNGAVRCWECGGRGHIRSKCSTFLARKKEKSESEAGKAGAQ